MLGRNKKGQKLTLTNDAENESRVWLKAVYHFHVFHYRMPETTAIAGLTSFIPSPLTIKMAMIAALFQIGDSVSVQGLLNNMDKTKVKIMPPKAALSFKAFMRYRSPPAIESDKGMDQTGSFYHSRPYIREYTLFHDNLTVFIETPINVKKTAEKALKNIRYLGCKDSLVSLEEITEERPEEDKCAKELVNLKVPGVAVLLADFRPESTFNDIIQLIPGNRDENMYQKKRYVLPGKILTRGKTRLFARNF